MNETEFSLALHARMSDVPVPLDDIVTGALVRGRRLRRRRTAARALSACGAVAAAAVVGAIAVGSVSNDATPTLDPATEPASTAVPVTHQFGIVADQTAQTLAGLLPAGSTSNLSNNDSGTPASQPSIAISGGGSLKSIYGGSATAPYRGAQLTFDDGHGPVEVEVMVQAPSPTAKPSLSTTDLSSTFCRQTRTTCTVVQGGTLITQSDVPEYTGSRSTDAAGNEVESSVATYQSDGWTVTVTAYNATSEKDGTVTRATPPLTTAQLGQIATYAGWLK